MFEEGSLSSQLKRLLVGKPIPSRLAHHERLSRPVGLAVLSSDALSSVAYATEEILRVLVLGRRRRSWCWPARLRSSSRRFSPIVVFSYRQTIHAYPSGGGAYIVGRDNLGETPALIAAAALLIDYVLTVAVSIAAGVAAITSAFPNWHVNRVELTLAFVFVLMVGNLRGIRESGRIFAVPTYFFITTMLALIVVGIWRVVSGGVPTAASAEVTAATAQPLTLFLLLRAFSNGCTAMTGVEAVSNGVPAFQPPESRNAAATMLMMAALSVTMFVGITLLAHAYHIIPNDQETVVSQLARGVFGERGVLVLRGPGRDHADPGAGREHGLRRFSSARVDPGARSPSAASVHEPGRPAGFFERYRRPERAGGDAAGRVRRRHTRAHPALHDRRLPVLHDLAGRHGRAVAAARRTRLARACGDECGRSAGHGHRADRGRRHQGRRRRLDHHAADSGPCPRLQENASAL